MKTLGTVEQIAELRRGVRRHALVESIESVEKYACASKILTSPEMNLFYQV